MGGHTLMKHCNHCNTDKPLTHFRAKHKSPDGVQPHCIECQDKHNQRNNPQRMYVNGIYIPKTHPLWKSGRYRTFEDAAFSSLENYSKNPKGDVYIIGNPAWNGWVKVGKAVDAENRLNSYQTSSPMRDYVLYAKFSCTNRNQAEKKAHKALAKKFDKRNEWFYCAPEDAQKVLEKLLT